MKRRFLAGLAAATAVATSLIVGTVGSAAAADSAQAPITEAQRSGGVTPNSKLEGTPIHVNEAKFKIVTTLRGVGKQVYDCKENPANGNKIEWVFREPVAVLYTLRGALAGIHGVGPFWTNVDGSRVKGSSPVPETKFSGSSNIPWLMLTGIPEPAPGVFARVTIIQRIDTRGGVAPASACRKGATASIDYTANYVFWEPIAKP
jgi:hypothetical protein